MRIKSCQTTAPAFADLVDALREELKHHGEMLALLEEQQEHLLRRAADRLVECAARIESQEQMLHKVQLQRMNAQDKLAYATGWAPNSPLADLVQSLADPHRLLILALATENSELRARVHLRSRQNQTLLLRSLQFMHQLVGTLFPDGTIARIRSGTIHGPPLPFRSVYELVC